MAHARRRFVEALEVSPLHKTAKSMKNKELEEFCKENPSYANILYVVTVIKKLFSCEKKYMESSFNPAQIKQKRQEEQKPLLDELFTRLEKFQDEYSTKSKMGVAITYALNQKEYLLNYLNDGSTEISNNRGERFIKPFVIGRKAWLFSNTKSGAEMSSTFYSLIESAKKNNLDIHEYLEYVLTEIQEHPSNPNY